MTPPDDSRPLPRRPDRRRHQRVGVALLGRYLLANRREYPCQTLDMSPGGLSILAPARGELGERVVVYLEQIGRIEGQIARLTERGMAIAFSVTARKRDKLAAQLTWLANRQSLGLPEDRRHERLVPRQTLVRISSDSGQEMKARLIDVSLSGAAIATEHRPPIGAALVVGSTSGRVVRHLQSGVAVEFEAPLLAESFDENVTL